MDPNPDGNHQSPRPRHNMTRFTTRFLYCPIPIGQIRFLALYFVLYVLFSGTHNTFLFSYLANHTLKGYLLGWKTPKATDFRRKWSKIVGNC